MPMRVAVPTAAASQVDRCSQVLHAATTRQVGLPQMGNETGAAMKLIKCMYAAQSVYLKLATCCNLVPHIWRKLAKSGGACYIV